MIGNQIPRIRIEPPRSDTDGKGAAMLMQAYGLTLDEWQRLVVDCWLGKDAAGDYTATSCGLSVSRQNGKNVCIEAREFYGLVVNGERILHTAHQVRTTKKAFRRLEGMFSDKRHPEIQQLVKQIRYAKGEESIELYNGGMIEFTARSRQAARGYDGISLVIYDEAQEVTEEQAEAIMAVLSASTTGTRQIIYTGTPPYPGCPGELFKRLRASCIEGTGKSLCWHEWSCTEGADASDRRIWYECNPALGGRLTEEFTAEEWRTLSPSGFLRERLGFWSRTTAAPEEEKAINAKIWDACRSDDPKPEGKTAYGVKFSADGSTVVLAGAVCPADGPARISIINVKPTGAGITWLASWLNERYKKASCVVIDGKNGADLLTDKIAGTWLFKSSVIRPKYQDVVTAADMLTNDLTERAVTWYSGQTALEESAKATTKRKIGGGWGFGGPGSELIEAAALALWGCRTSKRNPQRKMRIS